MKDVAGGYRGLHVDLVREALRRQALWILRCGMRRVAGHAGIRKPAHLSAFGQLGLADDGGRAGGMITINAMGLDKIVARSHLVTANGGDLGAFSRATSDPAFVKEFNDALDNMAKVVSYKTVLGRYLPCPVSMEKLGCG